MRSPSLSKEERLPSKRRGDAPFILPCETPRLPSHGFLLRQVNERLLGWCRRPLDNPAVRAEHMMAGPDMDQTAWRLPLPYY